jgi:branched-subunit amino acid transport protein
LVIVAVILASAAMKAVGPVVVGGRELPPRASAVLTLFAPALLAALLVTQTFGQDEGLVLDERVIGVGVAAVALALRAPLLVVIVLAAVATALARAFV